MLLSRFWYFLLAIAVAAATGAAMLSQAVINTRSDEALADSLARDRAMVDAMVRMEARARLDRIAFVTVDAKLGGILRAAAGVTDEKKLRELSAAAKETLRAHTSRIVDAARQAGEAERALELDPDLAFALDGEGRIIAQLGPLEANPPGASLATYPLVKRALQGYLRDDVWVYDRRVYRMAARPVMFGTEYAGAILHGYRLEKGLTDKLAKNLPGATVSFFHGGELLGVVSGQNAPQAGELVAPLSKLAQNPKFQSGALREVFTLQSGGHAQATPITGAAASAGVGVVVARSRRLLTSPEQLFEQASRDDVNKLPMPLLGGGALVLALLGLVFVYVEHDRHMKSLIKATSEIAGGERDRLIITVWRGAYRALADKINQAIDKEIEKAGSSAPTQRRKANLDELLGPTPQASATPFFGFAEDANAEQAEAEPAAAAASTPKAAPAPPSSPRLPPVPAPSAPKLPPVPAPPSAAATAAPAPATSSVGATPPGDGFDEQAHWHETYDQYIATRRQCGEAVDNLSFDKFSVTLKKTRDQVIEKQGAKSVRFAVHVKDGKAALKAQPVKR
jgi:hypothetical protein